MPYYKNHPALKVLETFGLGASKSRNITIANTNIDTSVKVINSIASFDKWTSERNEISENLVIQEWLIGDLSVSGYQKITIVLKQIGSSVSVNIVSKSKGGQIFDWGANEYNIKRVAEYLQNPNIQLTTRKVPRETEGFLIVLVLFILGFLGYLFIYNLLY